MVNVLDRLKMDKKVEVVGWGCVRYLHCGDLVEIAGDIHICDAPRMKWVNNQEVALIEMPDGSLLNLKDSQENENE